MLIKGIEVGHLETNCYIVTDENTLDCAIIDPGDESNTIMDYVEEHRLRPAAIFLTHGHWDHVGAVDAIAEELGIPVWINEKDTVPGARSQRHKYHREGTKSYRDGDILKVGELGFLVLETPGHSSGSVTLLCGNAMFCGDTLFKGSCGRVDFEDGDPQEMMKSLLRLSKLKQNYEVYPGHGEYSSLDRERRFNPYMIYAMRNEKQ
jgi:glyoxylase-like metal-dependent hydrolase (beta-lactamase superfamily II)